MAGGKVEKLETNIKARLISRSGKSCYHYKRLYFVKRQNYSVAPFQDMRQLVKSVTIKLFIGGFFSNGHQVPGLWTLHNWQ